MHTFLIHLHATIQKNLISIFTILFVFIAGFAYGQRSYIFQNVSDVQTLNAEFYVFQDHEKALQFQDVTKQKDFTIYEHSIPTLPVGNYWIRFGIKNLSGNSDLLMKIDHTRLDEIDLFIEHNGRITKIESGNRRPHSQKKYQHQKFYFDLKIPDKDSITCYMRVESREFVIVPLTIGLPHKVMEQANNEDIIFSILIGVFISVIGYNFLLYYSLRVKIYLYYVLYALVIAISQFTLFGYLQRFLFYENTEVAYWIYIVSSSFVGTFAALFVREFLNLKNQVRWVHNLITIIGVLFPFYLIFELLGLYQIKEITHDITGVLGCIVFYIAVYISIKKGNRSALFLLFGWTIFFVGYMLFILKNENILPYNLYTNYGVTAGAAIEALLLSFALADRINILTRDNEEKQKEIIQFLEASEDQLKISKQLAIDAERLKKEIVISEFESLKNQVNPHFLFNSLNVLSELVYEEQDQAVEFVAEMANVYRYVLDCKQKEVIELSAEIKFIRSFVFLLKIRFEENLNVEIDVPDFSNYMIAPVTLQLLVENAIKHNVISSELPLSIKIYIEGDFIVVKNTKQLRRGSEASTKVGLANIISRYKFLTKTPIVILDESIDFLVKVPLLFFYQKQEVIEAIEDRNS